PNATIATIEIAYATGPVSDATNVCSGASHGRLLPAFAANAPVPDSNTIAASDEPFLRRFLPIVFSRAPGAPIVRTGRPGPLVDFKPKALAIGPPFYSRSS